MSDFGPLRPYEGEFPSTNPIAPAVRTAAFVPDGSITDPKVAYGISPRKMLLIGAKVYRSTNQSIPDSSATEVEYDTEVYDEGGFWTVDFPKRLTAPYDGVYAVTFYADFNSNNVGDRRATVNENGGVTVSLVRTPTTGKATAMTLTLTLKLTAGDYVEYALTQTSTAALNVQSGEDGNFASMHFLGAL